MDAASPERCRSRQAMADVPQEPSRGHCGDGLFHRPNAHVWCAVLACRLADYADFGQVTSPFPPVLRRIPRSTHELHSA